MMATPALHPDRTSRGRASTPPSPRCAYPIDIHDPTGARTDASQDLGGLGFASGELLESPIAAGQPTGRAQAS